MYISIWKSNSDIDGVLNGRYTEESFGGYVFVSDEKISSCFGAPFPYYYFDTYFACPREHRW